MKIKTKLPINVTNNDLPLFKRKETYSIAPLKTKVLHHVFVSHWGLLIHHYLLPLKSAENLVGGYDQTFYWSHWKLAMEQYLVSRFGKSLKSIHLNDDTFYFSIHTPWFGYFSWFTTYLPRLISVMKEHPNAVLLVPEEWERIPYVRDSLKMFPDLKRKLIPGDHHIFVKNYVFKEVRPWTSQFYPDHIYKVRTVCLDYLAKHQVKIKPIDRIYLSRKKANRRKIINEHEVENYLAKHKFEQICFEDYTVFEQMFLMQHATMLVSMHGAGLTNMLFMKPGSFLLELTPVVEKPNQFRFPFWRIASLLEINYYVQFCKTIDKGEADLYARNLEVDMAEFNANVVLLLNANKG